MNSDTPIKIKLVNMQISRNHLAFLALAWLAQGAFADAIKITLEFKDIVPDVGLVWMSEDKTLKTNPGPNLDQKDKEFTKSLVVASPGSEVTFKNSDEVAHNIFALDQAAGVFFDVGMVAPKEQAKKTIDWQAGKVVRLGCKIHPEMKAYIANVESRYNKIISLKPEEVKSTLTLNTGAKLTKVAFWFPKFDPIEVDIPAGKTQSVPLVKKGEVVGTATLSR
jgi:plastocyanin